MKIRQGFVSNSSSSSFILIASPEAFSNARAQLSNFGKDLLDTEYPTELKTLDGKRVLVAYGEKSSEDFGNEACEAHDTDSCESYDEISKQMIIFEKAIKTAGGIADGLGGYY